VPIAVIDLEMTGLDPTEDRVCEVAVVRVSGDSVIAEYHALVRPDRRISPAASRISGITDAMVADAPRFSEVAADLAELLDGVLVISHNVAHDLDFLMREFELAERPIGAPSTLDTLLIARRMFAFPKNNLHHVATQLGVAAEGAHRALADARVTLEVWRRMRDAIDPEGVFTVGELAELLGALAPNSPLRLRQQQQLKEAFRSHRTVWIEYASPEATALVPVRREIGIWRLKLPYIQAWCFLRDGERVFRLDRIRTVHDGERAYDIPSFSPRI
jgi:DNA polymerase-3 subunit epsilon